MTDHTPGPWKLVSYEWKNKGGGDFVGRIDGPTGEKVYAGAASFHSINNLANARLIAAAPELLDALEQISEGKGRFSMDRLTHAENTIEDMIEIAKAAISKAKGK